MFIDTFPMSVMTFLLWVTLHKYVHSVGVLWIWLKNSGKRDTGHVGLSITWLSGRTSINYSAGQIWNTAVKQNQNLGRLFCLLERVFFVSGSACPWVPNQLKSLKLPFPKGGNWGTKKWRFSIGPKVWGLDMKFEFLDIKPGFRSQRTCKITCTPPHNLLTGSEKSFLNESVTVIHIQIWQIIQNTASQTLLPNNVWNAGHGGGNNGTEAKHWI